MKFLLVTEAWQPQVNGVVTTWTKVTDQFKQWGHEVEVIHPGLFRTIPCPKYPSIDLALWPGRKLKRLLDDAGAEAIHIATEGPLGLASRRHCLRRKWPFTTSYHTQFPHYLRKYIGLPLTLSYRHMRRFHRAAARTLVPTPSLKRELESWGFDNLVVWTRGVDFTAFKPLPEGESILDDPRPIFVYGGRVAVEKNLEAFLSLDLPGTKVIVGDGPALEPLQRKFPDARFLGYKPPPELAKYVASSDVFVFPSRTDTFGVVIIEALACGTPVAALPVTGPIDILENGVTGCLDEDLKTAAMAALELNRQDCIDAARPYTWQRCAQMVLDNLEPIR